MNLIQLVLSLSGKEITRISEIQIRATCAIFSDHNWPQVSIGLKAAVRMETVVWCCIEITLSDDPHASCSCQGHTYVTAPTAHTGVYRSCTRKCTMSRNRKRKVVELMLCYFQPLLARYRDASFHSNLLLSVYLCEPAESLIASLTLLEEAMSVKRKACLNVVPYFEEWGIKRRLVAGHSLLPLCTCG